MTTYSIIDSESNRPIASRIETIEKARNELDWYKSALECDLFILEVTEKRVD